MADPVDFNNVDLICHFNGADGSTTYTPDVGGGTFTMFGGCQLDTAVKKFGTASLQGTGTTSYCEYGAAGDFDYLHIGATNFTIECFVNIGTGNNIPIIDTAPASLANAGFQATVFSDGSVLVESRDGSGTAVASIFASTVISTSTMDYLAIVYDSVTGFDILVNAVSVATGNYTNTTSTNSSENLSIGRYRSSTALDMNGHIDSLRIVKNEALNITSVPTTEFPTFGTYTGTGAATSDAATAAGIGEVVLDTLGVATLEGPLESTAMVAYGFTDAITTGTSVKFVMDITGTTALRIPVSSWQGTLSDGVPGYLQAVIPNSIEYESEIATRLGNGESFKIYRVDTVNGVDVETLVMESLLESVSTYRGPFKATVVLAGYPIGADNVAPGTRVMQNIRTWNSSSNGKYRARCDIDYYLRPGDLADVDGYQFAVDYINYYAPTSGDIYMDIGAR